MTDIGEDTVSAKSGEGTAGTDAARNDATAPASGGDFGFKDPDKAFPPEEYKGSQETSVAARGEWQPKLKLPDGQPFEVPQDAQPEYPHNKVTESTNPNPDERHRMEIDDTPSEPRVTLVHKNGTGVEMMEKDGLMVVNSSGRMVQLVGDDFEMFVAGNGTVIYKGNLDWTVEGNMSLTVKGNMETTVEGAKTEVVKKSVIEEYQDDQETTVTNNKSTTVGDKNTETVLGDKNIFVKKKQSNWVNGDVEFLSGANTHISSQTKTSISSSAVNVTSSTVNIASGAGTIGGPGVYHYGYAWDGDLNVTGAINASGNTALGGDLSVNGRIDAGSYIFSPIDPQQVTEYLESEVAKLTASDKDGSDSFGYSVSISGDGSTAIVGAWQEDPSGLNTAGSAYIFELVNGQWTELAKLTASDKESNDAFGLSVSISGDGATAIVGAYAEDPSGVSAAGSAYIFEKGSGWTSGTEVAKLTALNKDINDNFGWSVSISSDGLTAIVGAYLEDPSGVSDAGSAYIFEKGSGWVSGNEVAKLTASDKESSDYFGFSVSISGDGLTAIVGAYLENPSGVSDAGSAYIFEKGSGWTSGTEVAKLTASDKESNDRFGYSVSISGDGSTAIVGAVFEDPSGSSAAGSAYIFEKGSGWTSGTEVAKLTASDKSSSDLFGQSVSISGDGSTAIVGAYLNNADAFSDAGSAYIFEKGSGWVSGNEVAKLTASDKAATDYFGHSVSISSDGSTAIVGAYLEDPSGFGNAGSAYIFDTSKIELIVPSDPFILDNSFYPEPTAGNIGTTLAASEEGIMQVSVDPGDKIKQSIDLRERIKLGLGQ